MPWIATLCGLTEGLLRDGTAWNRESVMNQDVACKSKCSAFICWKAFPNNSWSVPVGLPMGFFIVGCASTVQGVD